MPTLDAIKDAEARLFRDPALPSRLAAQVAASHALARKSHPRGAVALDAERTSAMSAITKLSGAEQLLALESAVEHFAALAAEAEAERQRQIEEGRRVADERRLAGQREAYQQAWADRVAAPTLATIRTLSDSLARSKERLSGIRSEIALRETIASLSDALKVATTALADEAKASIRRADEAAKAA